MERKETKRNALIANTIGKAKRELGEFAPSNAECAFFGSFLGKPRHKKIEKKETVGTQREEKKKRPTLEEQDQNRRTTLLRNRQDSEKSMRISFLESASIFCPGSCDCVCMCVEEVFVQAKRVCVYKGLVEG